MKKNQQKIVTIGGGTAHALLLKGLKAQSIEPSAIVNVTDNGGSTGILRKEMDSFAFGDIRQCILALSNISEEEKDIISYRFSDYSIKGHNLGNLILAAAEKRYNNSEKAIDFLCKLLQSKGNIIPATLGKSHLVATLDNGKEIIGENNLEDINKGNIKNLKLSSQVKINKKALKAIEEADKIVICAGNLYRSIVPVFLIDGMVEAIRKAKAKKIYICNLMTQKNHTENYFVNDFVKEIENYIGEDQIKYIIYNNQVLTQIQKELLGNFEVNEVLHNDDNLPGKIYIKENLINELMRKKVKGDLIKRTMILHDEEKLAKIVVKI